MNIPTLVAYEDTENLNLLDLSTFFTDTDESTVGLNYSIVQNSESEHVEVFTNYTNTLKFRPITPDWYGETNVQVQVIDSGKKKTYSNNFKIDVQPVNDEPTVRYKIPGVTLIESGKGYDLDLDLREYFNDIEDDYLFYSLAIDPENKLTAEQKEITAVIQENHLIQIESIDDFNTNHDGVDLPIPLWIYCDDDMTVNTMADGVNNYTRQQIFIRVVPVNDPPQWTKIPTTYLAEDDFNSFKNCVNLFDYLSDDESALEDLIIQIMGNSNPNIEVAVSKNYLSISTDENYYGKTSIALRASEPNPEFKNDIGLEIVIDPVNDRPWIIYDQKFIQYQDVNDTIILDGNMFDVENSIQLVELKIASLDSSASDAVNFDWQQAIIDLEYNEWRYTWDTSTVPDGAYRITARVYDGELMNETVLNVNVENGKNLEPIVEINTPIEDALVSGEVLIRGTVMDPDNNGIEQLQLRIGRDMDWTEIPLTSKNGTVDWFFSWDSSVAVDDFVVISAKATDGRSWSAPANRQVEVDNVENVTGTSGSIKRDDSKEINWIAMSIIIMIVVLLVIGLLVMFMIIRRSKKQIMEYVPDGRIEPLEEVEARLRPELGAGVSIEHMPLPPATGIATGTGMVAPALPAPVQTTTIMPALPAVNQPSPAMGGLPALPPAQPQYGLYSPQPAAPAAPAPIKPAKPVDQK
jgi:hypothetical protein